MPTKADRNASFLLWALALAAAMALLLTGCKSPPTKLEAKLFTVETNVVQIIKTNVLTVTNFVEHTEQTRPLNFLSTNFVTVTSLVPVVVYETNVVQLALTNYTFTPGPGAAAVVEAARGAGDVFGWGSFAGVLVGGLFGLWGKLRSRKAILTAENLAQGIELARRLLEQTPQGQALADGFTAWLVKHQAEAGVISEVVKILNRAVIPAEASQAAMDLAALVKSEKPTP